MPQTYCVLISFWEVVQSYCCLHLNWSYTKALWEEAPCNTCTKIRALGITESFAKELLKATDFFHSNTFWRELSSVRCFFVCLGLFVFFCFVFEGNLLQSRISEGWHTWYTTRLLLQQAAKLISLLPKVKALLPLLTQKHEASHASPPRFTKVEVSEDKSRSPSSSTAALGSSCLP